MKLSGNTAKVLIVLNVGCWVVMGLLLGSQSLFGSQGGEGLVTVVRATGGEVWTTTEGGGSHGHGGGHGGGHGHGHGHGHEHDEGDVHDLEGVHGAGTIVTVDHAHAVISESMQVGAKGAKGILKPGDRPELTKDVFDRVAINNQIIVTFANYQHREFIVSYVRNMAKLHITNYVIGAFDDKLMDYLIERGIYAVRVRTDEEIAEEGLGWGSPEFIKLMRAKYVTIGKIIKWGFELLVTDDDLAYLKNPLPYLYYHSRFADVLISTDNLNTHTYDGGLELPQPGKPEFNCGFVYIRPTQRSFAFFDALVKSLVADPKLRDQPAINILMAKGYEGMRTIPGTRIFHAWEGNLRVGALPTLLFCNGHTYFVQKLPQRLGVVPYMAHVTHVYCGDYGKRMRLRETMLFSDDVAYYADGKFLSYDPEIPREWFTDGTTVEREKIPEDHIKLGKVQVKQFMDAAMIARKTGRILIVPKVWAGCDRFWYFITECRAGGGRGFNLPFVAPLDHILNMQHFEELGIVDFRESSFLDDPRTPLSVTQSRLDIHFCNPDDGEPCDEINHVKNRELDEEWLQHGGTDEWWASKLNSPDYQDYRVIHISPMSRAVTEMADQEFFNGEWQNIAHRVAGVWCCWEKGPVKFHPYKD